VGRRAPRSPPGPVPPRGEGAPSTLRAHARPLFLGPENYEFGTNGCDRPAPAPPRGRPSRSGPMAAAAQRKSRLGGNRAPAGTREPGSGLRTSSARPGARSPQAPPPRPPRRSRRAPPASRGASPWAGRGRRGCPARSGRPGRAPARFPPRLWSARRRRRRRPRLRIPPPLGRGWHRRVCCSPLRTARRRRPRAGRAGGGSPAHRAGGVAGHRPVTTPARRGGARARRRPSGAGGSTARRSGPGPALPNRLPARAWCRAMVRREARLKVGPDRIPCPRSPHGVGRRPGRVGAARRPKASLVAVPGPVFESCAEAEPCGPSPR
jgi:hypothetical protein